ncbi:hypothetical protein QG37_06367 [Candidozyma auris]|nr:hypothetical protein QG37_06367 [[Candida] auris]
MDFVFQLECSADSGNCDLTAIQVASIKRLIESLQQVSTEKVRSAISLESNSKLESQSCEELT